MQGERGRGCRWRERQGSPGASRDGCVFTARYCPPAAPHMPAPPQTDMGAGHFSYNDRYVYLREKAFEYAWLLQTLGVKIS